MDTRNLPLSGEASARRNQNARRVLFDASTLLDALDESRPQSREACEALAYCNEC